MEWKTKKQHVKQDIMVNVFVEISSEIILCTGNNLQNIFYRITSTATFMVQ